MTISTAESEVKLAGLSTTALPAAIAGAIFHDAMMNGKFHGMIPAQTPIGSRRTMLSAGGNGLAAALLDVGDALCTVGEVVERTRCAGHVGEERLLDRATTVARLDLGDLGLTRELMISAALREVPGALSARHPRPGPLVERPARRLDGAVASSRPALATLAISSPVEGAKVGKVSPD